MRQLRQTTRTTTHVPGGALPDPFEPTEVNEASMATITHGPFAERVPIAGLTVGSIRRRFRDRYNLPSDGLGIVDGQQVEDDTVILAGQILTFMHRANAKGVDSKKTAKKASMQAIMSRGTAAADAAADSAPAVQIQGDTVHVIWPEGREVEVPLTEIAAALSPRWFGDTVWPDGVKVVNETSRGAIVVFQTPPRVHNLQWIDEESEADYGSDVKYRGVRVSMPYVILVAVFRVGRNGKLQLSSGNECFFANAPLSSVDDPMCYPALLNVSKMPEPLESRPLAWVCSQYLDRSFEKIRDTGERSRRAVRELARHLFEDGFNRSSEHHEGASWFKETVDAGIDERLTTVRAWEEATVADPMFSTDVKWLPTGMTLRQIMDRITDYMKLEGSGSITATDVGRIAMNKAGQKLGKKDRQAGAAKEGS